MTTRPTPTMPIRGRYTMARLRPTGTTTAPALPARFTTDPDGDPDFQTGWACDWTAAGGDGCSAPTPATCEGTDWPPMTAWQRYAEDRRLGQRVPPSVSTWRPEDVRRQQDVDAKARGLAPKPAVAVAWGLGPSCEGKAVR